MISLLFIPVVLYFQIASRILDMPIDMTTFSIRPLVLYFQIASNVPIDMFTFLFRPVVLCFYIASRLLDVPFDIIPSCLDLWFYVFR